VRETAVAISCSTGGSGVHPLDRHARAQKLRERYEQNGTVAIPQTASKSRPAPHLFRLELSWSAGRRRLVGVITRQFAVPVIGRPIRPVT